MDNKFFPIAIHGVPRSGTNWLGEIINSSPNVLYKFQPLFSYALKDFLTPSSSEHEINTFFQLLIDTNDDFLDRTEKRKQGILPIFPKKDITHVVYKEVRYHNILYNLIRKSTNIRLICIVRNPLSVINSWLKAPREFRDDLGWKPLEEWRYALKKNLNKPEEFNGYEKWKEATNIFLNLKKQYSNRVYIIEYQNLLINTLEEVENLFKFCQLSLTEQTKIFINKSSSCQNDNAYSVYRLQQSDRNWDKYLDRQIITEIINDLKNTELEKFLPNI